MLRGTVPTRRVTPGAYQTRETGRWTDPYPVPSTAGTGEQPCRRQRASAVWPADTVRPRIDDFAMAKTEISTLGRLSVFANGDELPWITTQPVRAASSNFPTAAGPTDRSFEGAREAVGFFARQPSRDWIGRGCLSVNRSAVIDSPAALDVQLQHLG